VNQKTQTLPPDEIIVREGKVSGLTEWTLWNGTPEITLEARREKDDYFVVESIDPEHGGNAPQSGETMLEAASKALHTTVATKLAALFDLENPTEQQIRDLHYRKNDGLVVKFA